MTVHTGGDPAETDRLTRQLCTEQLVLDLDRVEFATDGELPPHAKSGVTRNRDRKIIVQGGTAI